MLVEIWSDVVCPWCAIGKARFARALDGFAHADEVEVVFRSFELDPNAPELRRGTMAEHLSRKYGMSIAEAEKTNSHLEEVAALDGLEFHFDRARPGNTFDAHRLLQFAAERGCQHELLGALMDGYFRDGMPVSDVAWLADAATGAGLSVGEVTTLLEGDAYAEAVRADEARAHDLGITGVPFFLIEGKYAIPGAQSIERFGMGLDRAWGKLIAA
jgi:predicted DsbA family dithiol-disulfide isomerase